MKKLFFSLGMITSLSLCSCSTILNNLPGVYMLEIQQGNIIDQSMINQLKPNMDKRQVLYIMGSPMLVDFFHKDRWEYVYTDKRKGEDRVEKKISLVFKEDKEFGQERGSDKLIGVYGDLKPDNLPVIKQSDDKIVDVPKRELDKTLWEKITGLFGFDSTNDTPAATDKKPNPKSGASNLPF